MPEFGRPFNPETVEAIVLSCNYQQNSQHTNNISRINNTFVSSLDSYDTIGNFIGSWSREVVEDNALIDLQNFHPQTQEI